MSFNQYKQIKLLTNNFLKHFWSCKGGRWVQGCSCKRWKQNLLLGGS